MKLLACEICGNANYYCAECGTCFKCSAEDHEQQLQQARKEGWEQCKREASHICRDGIPTSWGFTSSQELSDAINTMEYKEV